MQAIVLMPTEGSKDEFLIQLPKSQLAPKITGNGSR
jgi:hypothetical protein